MNLLLANTFEGKVQPCSFPEKNTFVHTPSRTYTYHELINCITGFKVASRIWALAGCTLDVFVERLNSGQAGPILVMGQADTNHTAL